MSLRADVCLSHGNGSVLEIGTSAKVMSACFPSLVQNLFLNIFKEIRPG